MKLKSGKEEIICLLDKVIRKFEEESGGQIIRNSNRRHYEAVARRLSEISNQLPQTADALEHDSYPKAYDAHRSEYPFRKYDITGNQIKDAFYNRIVTNPRPFLVDACYIYLYGKGRKGFAEHPTDPDLLDSGTTKAEDPSDKRPASFRLPLMLLLLLAVIISSALAAWLWTEKRQWEVMKQDMNLIPYHPTEAEADSLEGVWLCYTGSPQARSFDPERYHMVVSNIMEVKRRGTYFTFTRYGSNFDHTGYMQFESPGLVSVHSKVIRPSGKTESPKHSLFTLEAGRRFQSVISASWNFDIGERNRIIGIREVFMRLGKGGRVEEILNTPENVLCRCKIVKWHHEDGSVKAFQLRNESLDSLKAEPLKSLLDEKSILLREPGDGLILPAPVR